MQSWTELSRNSLHRRLDCFNLEMNSIKFWSGTERWAPVYCWIWILQMYDVAFFSIKNTFEELKTHNSFMMANWIGCRRFSLCKYMMQTFLIYWGNFNFCKPHYSTYKLASALIIPCEYKQMFWIKKSFIEGAKRTEFLSVYFKSDLEINFQINFFWNA